MLTFYNFLEIQICLYSNSIFRCSDFRTCAMLTLENLTRWGFTRVSWKTTHLKTSCVAETACSLTAKTPQPQTNRNSDRHLLILKIFCCKSFLTILISCQYQLYVHCVQLVSVLARLWFFFPRVSFSHSHNTVCIFIIITY